MSQFERLEARQFEFALKIAKTKTAAEKRETAELELLHDFKGETGRLLCPFCQYSSPKNKMSAIIADGRFKCFACGAARRVA